MRKILLQNVSTTEIKEVIKAICLFETGMFEMIRIDISELKNHRQDLLYGAVPVGSVEFCREAMKVAGIKEPAIDPYPLLSWVPYYRVITKLPASFALSMSDNMFIKPTKLKRFNGFVYNKSIPVMELNEHDKEQVKILMKMPDTEQVYIADVVDFLSEFRYYIDDNKIIGFSRYDDSDEEGDHLIPNLSVVEEFAAKVNKQHPYVLDFGVLKSGETALVELNHFYAIGFYQDGITAKEYLRLLVKYWDFIRS
jgi:hypothetical protein